MVRDVFSQPPQRVLKELFVPMALGFMMLMLIDFADVVAAQMVSDEALAIVNYCFPIIYFVLAAGIGINQGLTVVGADAFTKKDHQALAKLVCHAVYLSVFYMALLVSFILAGLHFELVDVNFMPFISEIRSFLTIILTAVLPTFVLLVVCAWLQIQGRVRVIQDTLLMMLIATIVLHPLFALPVGLGLGLEGVALSKLTVVMIGILVSLPRANQKGVQFIHKPSRRFFKPLFKHTFAAICIQWLVPLYLYVLNQFVADYGVLAVAGFGLGYRIAMLVVVPILAVLIAILVVVSHYYSTSAYAQMKALMHMILRRGSIAVIGLLLLTASVSTWVLDIIGITQLVSDVATQYLWVAVILTVFEFIVGVTIVYFQALQQPLKALGVALTKTVIFPLPFLLLAKQYLPDLTGVWIAITASFFVSGIIAIGLLSRDKVLRD